MVKKTNNGKDFSIVSGKNLKVLFITPFVPYPPEDGGRIRIYNLIKQLRIRHEVDVLSLANPGAESDSAAEKLRKEGIGIELIRHRRSRIQSLPIAIFKGKSLYQTLFESVEFGYALAQRLQDKKYDIVQYEYAYMGYYCVSKLAPSVLDEHNIEFRLNETLAHVQKGIRGILYRVYSWREKYLRRIEELNSCRKFDNVLVVSKADQGYLLREAPELKTTVIPNGVDLNYFSSSGFENNPACSGVFIGKMDYLPNIDAVEWFCRDVLKLIRKEVPKFTFNIVGSNPTPAVLAMRKLPGVKVLGRVCDTRPHLLANAVVVIPLRAGSGTRLKILEALSMGCAVVSSSIGCEGIEVVDGEHLYVADDSNTLADRVVNILKNNNVRRRLGLEGRRLVEAKYGWPAIAASLDQLYQKLNISF